MRRSPARPVDRADAGAGRPLAFVPGRGAEGGAVELERGSADRVSSSSVRPIADLHSPELSTDARARRIRRPDLLAQLPMAIAVLSWGAAALAIMFYDNSRPRSIGLDRFFNPYRTEAGAAGADAAAGCALAVLLLSAAGLLVNSRRMKRRDDRYSRSLILLLGLSSLALLWYGVR